MSIIEKISKKLEDLDVDRLEEVLDFVEFLRKKDFESTDPERADPDSDVPERIDTYRLSENRLAESWSGPEDEKAWKDL